MSRRQKGRDLSGKDEISSAQVASSGEDCFPSNCQTHHKEQIRGYCDKCEKAVCWKCVILTCIKQGHLIENLEASLLSKSQEMNLYFKELENVGIKNIELRLAQLEDLDKQIDIEKSAVTTIIEKTGAEMIEFIMKKTQQLKDLTDKVELENRTKVRAHQETVTDCLVTSKALLKDYKEKTASKSRLEILELLKAVQTWSKFVEWTIAAPDPAITRATLSKQNMDSIVLENMIGKLETENETNNAVIPDLQYINKWLFLSSFKVSRQGIIKILPQNVNAAWVICELEKQIRLVDKDGFEMSRVVLQSYPTDIALVKDNTLLMTCSYDNKITMITTGAASKQAVISALFGFGNLRPQSIAVCPVSARFIWVGLIDDDYFTLTENSKRLIRCYSWEGVSIYDVQYDDKGKPLYVIPTRLAISNTNYNVATINKLADDQRELVITDTTGELVKKLKNNPSQFFNRKMNPTDIHFNMLGDLVISDKNSKSVIILDDSYKNVLGIYKLEKHSVLGCHPAGSPNMWLGENSGHVMIVKYLHTKSHSENEND